MHTHACMNACTCMHMYVCLACICTFMHMLSCMHACIHACMYARMHACMHMLMHTCTCSCIHAHTYMHACMHMQAHACACACMFVRNASAAAAGTAAVNIQYMILDFPLPFICLSSTIGYPVWSLYRPTMVIHEVHDVTIIDSIFCSPIFPPRV